MYCATVRRRKLLVAVRVQLSLVATDIWSSSNWSKRCSRTIRCQKTRTYLEEQIRNIYRTGREEPRRFLRPKTSTGKVHTAVPVSKVSMNTQIKVPEPKAFDGEKKDAKSWLK